MSYQVLARKWRPRNFPEMVGQEHVLRALRNALDSNRFHHACLFTGTRGVGKTTLARILAKCLNCETGADADPCGECAACKAIDAGRFVDLIEVDAASRAKVDETRELMEQVPYAPTMGRYKVYLIDEVHMFSNHSFNALLKILEEPPGHVKFLLATTEPKRIPITILSRCLQLNLRSLSREQISSQLIHILDAEEIAYSAQAVQLLAGAAGGSLRDALSLLDQAISDGHGKLDEEQVQAMLGTVERTYLVGLMEALIARDGAALLQKIQQIADFQPDFRVVLAELLTLLQQIAICQIAPKTGATEAELEVAQRLAPQFSPEETQLLYQIALTGQQDLHAAPDPQIGFQMCLIRMLAFCPAASVDSRADSRADSQVLQAPPPARVQTNTPPLPLPQNSEQAELARWWQETVTGLSLQGLLKQLAQHCMPCKYESEHLVLMLDPSQRSLRSGEREKKLQEALGKYLSMDKLRLEFSFQSPQGQTPAKRSEENKQKRQQKAVETIEQDPNIRRLQEQFGATIEQDSIRPSESETGE